MGSRTLLLIMFLSALCAVQALKCNYCKKIDKNNPTCDGLEEKECTSGHDVCIRILMHPPAYGEVRRCGKAKECEVDVPIQVERRCCNTDLCN